MKFIYFTYCCFLLLLLVLFFGPVILCGILINSRRSIDFVYVIFRLIARLWLRLAFFSCAIDVVKAGLKRQYIYIANHSSYLDVVTAFAAIKGPYRILGKHGIGEIPFLGFFYRRMVICVDRYNLQDRAARLKTLNGMLRQGYSLFIFPEGTFNETANTFKSFHDGAFQLALSCEVPLQPILFPDNGNQMHYSSILSIRPGKLHVVFLDDITTVGYNRGQTSLLKSNVIQVMEKELLFLRSSR